ncbi:MAG TPA: N-6 DNA methylase, partial [Longimicrobiales bacterium]|nr:N-6 DNA methylase [Longimicrobiales bacterium]
AEAEAVRRDLRRIHDRQREALEAANEAQTEERFIRPVLEALGWGWEVQPRSVRQGQTQFPDYALFPGSGAADTAAAERDRRHVLKRSIGVLEAKRWGRGLDARGAEGDLGPNRVPSAQIINYLIRSEQPWGILTNGLEWRIYHRDADFADTVFFAVELPALLGEEPLPLGEAGETIPAAEAFRYFYLFFRPGAFTPGPSGRRWLDLALESSIRYARAVEDALKPRAYRAVTALCAGFVSAGDLEPGDLREDPQLGREVLDNALTVLFRLLFLLYAESRELLPVRTHAAYRRKGLMQLRERAAQIRDAREQLFPRGRDLWNDLRDLFRIVDGHPDWRLEGLPVYNGGLFDADLHPWIERHYVPDPQLAEALDLLSRTEDPDTGELHLVDYSPLDVRHLGSIYEGLLEYVVRVADEDLGAIREKGRVVRDPVRPGEVYLATDRGERKVSGSYYTPDYVVQYIVQRTLAPLVEGRSPQAVLRLKVLDPAMGSGHFLVAATAYLARAAVQSVEESDQTLLGEFAQLDPEHLRRLVVERCIFGVDKNPRAVELAKLALWLVTVQRDKPLNFLDHHLKCGDSLLGARVERLGSLPGRRGAEADLEAAGQYHAFESALRERLGRALAFVELIEELGSDTLDQLARKKDALAQADALLDRFREAADLWSSRLLDNDVDD